MSKTIRNERTKVFLDKLQSERRTRKIIRCHKADELFCDWDDKFLNELE